MVIKGKRHIKVNTQEVNKVFCNIYNNADGQLSLQGFIGDEVFFLELIKVNSLYITDKNGCQQRLDHVKEVALNNNQ